MTKHDKRVVALILNIALVVMEIIGLVLALKTNRLGLFKFYTDNSNILTLISSACFSVYLIVALRNEKVTIPLWLKYLKYFSVCMMSVTFFVVTFILCPLTKGLATGFLLFYDSMLFFHFFCPLTALISFTFFEDDILLRFKDTFWSLLPTGIYAVIIIILNLVRSLVGPYPFLHLYEQSIFMTIVWCISIFSLAYLLGYGVYAFKNCVNNKARRKTLY